MNGKPPVPYRAVAALVPPLARLLGGIAPPISLAVRGRDASRVRIAAWASTGRTGQPLLLVHAPSAGEWRQAEAVVRSLRAIRPSWQYAFTYTSPSAEAVAAELHPDVHGFLPWDTPGETGQLLDVLRPTILAIVKLDLWPELAFQAHARGIPIALIAATVRPNSSRLRWPAHSILRRAYGLVDRALAVSPEDAARLASLGVPPDRISEGGDPRYDAVAARIAGMRSEVSAERMVAGSTWPPDDEVLLAAFAKVRRTRAEARLLLAPHRPDPARIARIATMAGRHGLPAPRPWSEASSAEVLTVLEQVGPLGLLYGKGVLAYVGGGFGRAGLHSVLEPAAWGLPVLVGPRWTESRDAVALREAGALVPLDGRDPVEQLARCWLGWLDDIDRRREAGTAALGVVRAGAGAAARAADLLLRLVETKRGRE